MGVQYPSTTYESHSSGWWNEFWDDRDRNFGSPRSGLIDTVVAHARKQADGGVARVADVGSGNGRYAVPFAKLGLSTTAIEMSPTACELIRSRATSEGVPRHSLSIVNADVLALDAQDSLVPPDSYDVVFSSGLLEEIGEESQERAARNMARLVRCGGLLVLKYCLEIDGRGVTVKEDSVPALFLADDRWDVSMVATDPDIRASIATINFENRIRTETVIAQRVSDALYEPTSSV